MQIICIIINKVHALEIPEKWYWEILFSEIYVACYFSAAHCKYISVVLAHRSNGSIRTGMIQCNFDTNHIGSTSNPNFISLQVDLIQMFLDFLLKTTGLTRSAGSVSQHYISVITNANMVIINIINVLDITEKSSLRNQIR
jgi:hypothetical protein